MSRQSNLVVESSRSVSTDKLMDMTEVARLIDDAEMRATIQQRAALFSLPQSN